MNTKHLKPSDLSDRNAVLKAISEFDEIGETEFLEKFARGKSTRFDLIYEGKRYPPKAILQAAFLHQYDYRIKGFGGGEPTNKPLRKLGFQISGKNDESHSTAAENGTENHPLNQILYGPPGTGKTWHSVNYALSIVKGKNVKDITEDDRSEFRKSEPENKSGQIAFTTFHQNYAYEDFIEGIRPKVGGDQVNYEIRAGIFKKLAGTARNDKHNQYVLIIDEINRGNIAKIFGELITLIEDSKRLGKPDEQKVILPYSQESFDVPSNLYIVGTMNTADRSIQILDTALRRRFTFIEMMPNSAHEKISSDIQGVNCQKLLKSMNQRIFMLLDRERQIGHTYFFGIKDVDDLANRFQNRIIPLLQEYFYDDWAKMKAVLGNNAFIVEASSNGRDEGKYYKLLSYSNEKWKSVQQYQEIYVENESSKSNSQ